MSGIAGILDSSASVAEGAAAAARRMMGALANRGQGGYQVWTDEGAGVALAVRGAGTCMGQPARSQDTRWIAVFDGTIHNRADLHRRLDPSTAAPESDAALLAEAAARWGVERALQAIDGSFAAALWDRQQRTFVLARDPMGKRPLVWARMGKAVLFGSEARAFSSIPGFAGHMDREALALYLQRGWVPAPFTLHREVRKLAAGTMLVIKGGDAQVRRYWSAAERARSLAGAFTGGPSAAAERLNRLLRASVAQRIASDTQVGVLLSGGAAPALIAAIARELMPGPLRTVALAFEGENASGARAVAAALATRHEEVRIADADAPALVAGLAPMADEPFAAPGYLSTMLAARAAREHVTVALSGQGGDALFGLDGFLDTAVRTWRGARDSNSWLKRGVRALPGPVRGAFPGLDLLEAQGAAETAVLMRALWRGIPTPLADMPRPMPAPEVEDPRLQVLAAEVETTLPDDVCARCDRAGAAHGLDVRLPFLDGALADLAFSLPDGLALSAFEELLPRYLPDTPPPLPCAGPPLARWLAGPLKDWAGDLLSPERLRGQGWLDPTAIARLVRRTRSGRGIAELWAVLMFQAWLDAQG
ncbi:MAG: asparagine synthetase B family protein [Solirubrobacterales bacterium]